MIPQRRILPITAQTLLVLPGASAGFLDTDGGVGAELDDFAGVVGDTAGGDDTEGVAGIEGQTGAGAGAGEGGVDWGRGNGRGPAAGAGEAVGGSVGQDVFENGGEGLGGGFGGFAEGAAIGEAVGGWGAEGGDVPGKGDLGGVTDGFSFGCGGMGLTGAFAGNGLRGVTGWYDSRVKWYLLKRADGDTPR